MGILRKGRGMEGKEKEGRERKNEGREERRGEGKGTGCAVLKITLKCALWTGIFPAHTRRTTLRVPAGTGGGR